MLVIAASCAVVPGAALAGSRRATDTPTDRAAVHAYLLDMYAYTQAVTEVAPAVVTAYEGASNRIAGECPGVLAGAPQDTKIVAAPSIPSRTARQLGEEKRRSTQLSDLEAEVGLELLSAELEPRRAAMRTLLTNLEALPQGDPLLSQVVHADTIGLEEDLRVESTDVCADMRAWVASGYRTLSAASRVIALKRETALVGFVRDLAAQSASEAMSATETPADKALVSKTSQLELQTAETIANSIDSARKRVEATLGLTARANREKRLEPISHESKSSTEIGAGRTAAGSKYTVWLERTKGGSADACKLNVELRGADGAKPGLLELLSSESGVCFSPRKDRSEAPSIKCSEGLLKIEAEVLSATRTVDLRMSDGSQIVSRPVLVPRRLGGPDAFYYQAVRGPSPIPVSLIERDAHGHTLRMLKLQRIVGCSRHPLKYLPGGKHTLARGQTPQGLAFSIVGERYRLFGRIHIQLKLEIGEGLLGSGEGEEEGPNESNEGPSGLFAMPVKRTTPLYSEVSAGCHPHEYSVFYGLLKQPRDTVLVKVAGKLMPVLRAGVPASLHAGGVLVYLASSGRPEEVVVRAPSGKVVTSEDLSRAASEGRETCEGESEGPGPPPGGGFGETGETSRIVLNR